MQRTKTDKRKKHNIENLNMINMNPLKTGNKPRCLWRESNSLAYKTPANIFNQKKQKITWHKN